MRSPVFPQKKNKKKNNKQTNWKINAVMTDVAPIMLL